MQEQMRSLINNLPWIDGIEAFALIFQAKSVNVEFLVNGDREKFVLSFHGSRCKVEGDERKALLVELGVTISDLESFGTDLGIIHWDHMDYWMNTMVVYTKKRGVVFKELG